MKVGDLLWHPCSMDIIEHKVVGVHTYEGFTQVTTKATHNVGSCGKIECVLDIRKGRITFVELVDEDDIEYASGLQDFIEGEYYTSKPEARKEFYRVQHTIVYGKMKDRELLYKESVEQYERVQRIIKEIEEELICG